MNRQTNRADNIVIYSVYLKSADDIQANNDILPEARRRFFLTRKKTKDKIFFTSGEDSVRCSYQIDSGKPMKWKKDINGRLSEYSQSDASGNYNIICLDHSGAVAKKMYFSSDNIWQKSEYFSENILTATLISARSGGDFTIAVQYPGESAKLLSAVAYESDGQGEVIAVAETSDGKLYFVLPPIEEAEPPKEISEENIKRKGFFFDASLMYGDFTTLNIKEGSTKIDDSLDAPDDKPLPDDSEKQPQDEPELPEPPESPKTPETPEAQEPSETPEPPKAPAPPQKYDEGDAFEIENEPDISEEFADAAPDSEITVSDKERYAYFGSKNKRGERSGSGITLTSKGSVLYSGAYVDDKRCGFGAQYYKNGKLAYVGKWSGDRKNGFGFSLLGDGSVVLGEYIDDKRRGSSAQFDKDGRLVSVTSDLSGGENSVTIERKAGEKRIMIRKSLDNSPLDKVTVLDSDGNIIYNGEMHNGEYSGDGKLFDGGGKLRYSGEFKNSLKNGTGVLYLDDNSLISGEFHNDEIVGAAIHRGCGGEILYKGGFKDGEYSGSGTLYNSDGSYYSAKFSCGRAVGAVSLYSKDGELIYKGELQNGEYSGSGTLYSNGEKVYEGAFVYGRKSGLGREYSDSLCIYMGDHENGERNGFGISYAGGKIEYSGYWNGGRYDGLGVLHSFDDGFEYAGSFSGGKMNGRINIIEGERLRKKCIYEDGECVYMREYDGDGAVIYDGGTADGLREGMGCSYSEFGEKIFEGIFKYGEPYKAMKVIPRQLEELEYSEKLKDTPYNNYVKPPQFVVEQFLGKGIYSGSIKNDKPDGKGTMLYTDHRYTGAFSDGKPDGYGVLYFGDGKERRGSFSAKPTDGCELIQFADASYYFKDGGEA